MGKKRSQREGRRAGPTEEVQAEEKLARYAMGFAGELADLDSLPDGDGLALIAALNERALRRAGDHATQPELLPAVGWRVGYAIGVGDRALAQMNAPWHWNEVSESLDSRWLKELRTGLDTFARAAWCFRFGYTLAGIALARRHIERWTYNLASSAGVPAREGEEDAGYFDRVWSTYDNMRDVSVGRDWSRLSEVLHGRSIELGVRAVRVDLRMQIADAVRVHNFALRALEVSLRHVRGAIKTAIDERQPNSSVSPFLWTPLEGFPRASVPPDFLLVFFEPLDYEFAMSDRAEVYSSWGSTYRRIVEGRSDAGEFITEFEAWMAIEERWVRAIDESKFAFTAEATALGSRTNPVIVHATIARYRCVAEMADLVASSIQDPEHRAAMRCAAAALESAWVLWLQDVDDSLTCMRMVLECTARARTYRLKPERAQRLAERGASSTPYRWAEAAGWSRLAPFVRALGEFSHVRERSRHDGSRDLLTAIQQGAIEGHELQTGRGSALNEVASMLAHEVVRTLSGMKPDLAATFRTVTLSESEAQTESELAGWLDRAMSFRGHDFGDADYRFSRASNQEQAG